MHLHYPSVVLVPDTFFTAADAAFVPSGKRSSSTSLLVEYIREEFPDAQIEPVGRKYWNDAGGNELPCCPPPSHDMLSHWLSIGLEFIVQLCVEDSERAGMIIAVSDK